MAETLAVFRMLTDTETESFQVDFAHKNLFLQVVYCAVDGLKILFEPSRDIDIQSCILIGSPHDIY
eukprot:IDg17226t1